MAERAIGLVLAAGAGTRYGSPKVLAHNGDWLDAAVRALVDGGCDDVLVMLGAADSSLPDGARAVYVRDWATGMSASLKAGLSAAESCSEAAALAVVHVVDTPDVGAEVVGRVLDAARTTPSHLARAVFDGSPGHPVVLGREHWADVMAGATGDAGARAFLHDRSDVVRVECSHWATGIDHDYR